MDEFLDIVKVIITIFLIVGGIILFVVSGIETTYFFAKIFDASEGSVYCDFDEIYKGKLYKVSYELATENLQAPMFNVVVRDDNNFLKIEKTYFCGDFKISDK